MGLRASRIADDVDAELVVADLAQMRAFER